jgi:hypothetical protein
MGLEKQFRKRDAAGTTEVSVAPFADAKGRTHFVGCWSTHLAIATGVRLWSFVGSQSRRRGDHSISICRVNLSSVLTWIVDAGDDGRK